MDRQRRRLPQRFDHRGTLAIDRLDATAPALAGDRVRLARVELPWRLAAQPAGLAIEDLQLRSDVGQVGRAGHDRSDARSPSRRRTAPRWPTRWHDMTLNSAARSTWPAWRRCCRTPCEIRSDTTITSGTIQLAARSATGGRRPTSHRLAANGPIGGHQRRPAVPLGPAGQRQLRAPPPTRHVAARRAQMRLGISQSRRQRHAATIDRHRPVRSQSAGRATWSIRRFERRRPGRHRHRQARLAANGADKFSATATGELAQLRIALGDGSISSGRSNVAANIRIAGNAIDVTDCKLVVTDLRATSPGWNINEPRVELAGDAHWNGATGEIAANTAQLVTSTVSLAAKDVRYRARNRTPAQPASVNSPAWPRFAPTWPASPHGAPCRNKRRRISQAANSPATSASPNKRTASPAKSPPLAKILPRATEPSEPGRPRPRPAGRPRSAPATKPSGKNPASPSAA